MGTMYAFLMASVDGYYVGPNQEFDWPLVDEEFNEFAIQQLDRTGTLVFGRTTYEMMAGYWPTPAAMQDDPEVTSRMNEHPKVVVSGTLEGADWANTRLLREDVTEELSRLKQQPQEVGIFGSSALTVSLMEAELVDELRIIVTPVVLGAGLSLFRTADHRFRLTLRQARTFRSGNVLLTYQPAADR
jgi:dihydrofolate reductase